MTNKALPDKVMRLDSGKGHMFRLEGNWYPIFDAVKFLESLGFSQDEAIGYIQKLFKEYQYNLCINHNVP